MCGKKVRWATYYCMAMKFLRLFFHKRALISSLVFSVPFTLLFAWRYTHLRSMPLFASEGISVFGVFFVVNYMILLTGFYLLAVLANRKQQIDE